MWGSFSSCFPAEGHLTWCIKNVGERVLLDASPLNKAVKEKSYH